MLTHTPMESHETHPIVGVALAECTASDSWWKRSMHVATSCYRILNKGLCTVARSHRVGEGHDDSSLWSVGIVAVAYFTATNGFGYSQLCRVFFGMRGRTPHLHFPWRPHQHLSRRAPHVHLESIDHPVLRVCFHQVPEVLIEHLDTSSFPTNDHF